MFEGHPLMTGGVLSITVTVNEQVEVLLELSVAVYVTVVVPLGNVDPGAKFVVKLFIAQLSVAVGAVHDAAWSHVVLPTPVLTVWFDGHPLMTGRVVSLTVTVN